jgi:L-alanine-DL-glutamate epimerase-like enolase superfamily enzyme
MTLSLVAVITDAVRDGRRVVGYGFNSNGRYGQGALMRERFIPRILGAPPESLLDDAGENLDPNRVWAAMFKNEKPGGHGERSVAVGTIDMAVWDAVAKIAGKPLFRLLGERYGGGRRGRPARLRLRRGGYYYPGKDIPQFMDEMRSYLDRGYTVVKMKVGGAPLADDLKRIEAVLGMLPAGCRLAVDANGRFDLQTAVHYAKALSAYDLFWYEEAGDPLDYALQAELAKHYAGPMATGENLFSMQDARNLIRYGGMRPDRDWLQFDCALSYGLVEYLRTLEMLRSYGWSPAAASRTAATRCRSTSRPARPRRQRELPGPLPALRRLPRRRAGGDGHITMPDLPGIGFEGKSDLYAEMRASPPRPEASTATGSRRSSGPRTEPATPPPRGIHHDRTPSPRRVLRQPHPAAGGPGAGPRPVRRALPLPARGGLRRHRAARHDRRGQLLLLGERKALLEAAVRAGIAPSKLMPGTGVAALTETVEPDQARRLARRGRRRDAAAVLLQGRHRGRAVRRLRRGGGARRRPAAQGRAVPHPAGLGGADHLPADRAPARAPSRRVRRHQGLRRALWRTWRRWWSASPASRCWRAPTR